MPPRLGSRLEAANRDDEDGGYETGGGEGWAAVVPPLVPAVRVDEATICATA